MLGMRYTENDQNEKGEYEQSHMEYAWYDRLNMARFINESIGEIGGRMILIFAHSHVIL